MGKPRCIIHEQLVSAQTIVTIPKKCLEVTIRCHQDSGANARIGWNENASSKNILEPGESVTYGREDYYIDGNNLSVDFDASTDPMCLITIVVESEEVIC